MGLVISCVTGVRNVRGECNVPPGKKVRVFVQTRSSCVQAALQRNRDLIASLCGAEEVSFEWHRPTPPARAAVYVDPAFEAYVPLAGLIDFAEEEQRLGKRLEKAESELAGIERRLSNAGFVAKAPPEVVEKDRARAEELRAEMAKLRSHIARITEGDSDRREKMHESQNPGGAPPSTPPAPAPTPAAETPAPAPAAPMPAAPAPATPAPLPEAAPPAPAPAPAPAAAKPAARKPARKKPAKKTAKKKAAKKPAKKKASKKAAKKKPARKKAAKRKTAKKKGKGKK
jgi:valyl-tRNA synthetase